MLFCTSFSALFLWLKTGGQRTFCVAVFIEEINTKWNPHLNSAVFRGAFGRAFWDMQEIKQKRRSYLKEISFIEIYKWVNEELIFYDADHRLTVSQRHQARLHRALTSLVYTQHAHRGHGSSMYRPVNTSSVGYFQYVWQQKKQTFKLNRVVNDPVTDRWAEGVFYTQYSDIDLSHTSVTPEYDAIKQFFQWIFLISWRITRWLQPRMLNTQNARSWLQNKWCYICVQSTYCMQNSMYSSSQNELVICLHALALGKHSLFIIKPLAD